MSHGSNGGYNKADSRTKAEPLYQRALEILENVVGADPIETSAALLGLATVHTEAAAYDRAEPLFERALAIRERVSGAESADTASVLNDMGNLCFYMGDYARAKTLYTRPEHSREGQWPRTSRDC